MTSSTRVYRRSAEAYRTKLIMRRATSLEGCVVTRPAAWQGRVEIVTSQPALRAFPLHVSLGLGLCWKLSGGSHAVRADGRSLSYPPGYVSIRAPGCVWACEANDAAFLSIDFAPEVLPDEMQLGPMTFVRPEVLPNPEELAVRLSSPESRLAGDEQFASLWAALSRQDLATVRELSSDAGSLHARRARAYLAEHFADNPTLDELARVTGTNKFGLLRSFKRCFGITPHALQVQLRIEAARELLARGAGIAHAATSVGFADQSHFGRHFKRVVGLTPREYLGA